MIKHAKQDRYRRQAESDDAPEHRDYAQLRFLRRDGSAGRVQICAAAFAEVGLLRVLEATGWAEHISSIESLEYFPAFTLRARCEFAPLLPGRALGRRFNLPGALFDENDLARRHVVQSVDRAARPSRFDRLRLRRLAQAEIDRKSVV